MCLNNVYVLCLFIEKNVELADSSVTAARLCHWRKTNGSVYLLYSENNNRKQMKMDSDTDEESYSSDDGESSPLRGHKG